MKTLGAFLGLLGGRRSRQSVRILVWLLLALVAMVALYSLIFHQLMGMEGRVHSWPTSIYWTLTTMSTLGFGDITFQSDAGRLFSVVVLISGALFLLVILPFTIIQFIVAPWMDARQQARTPRKAPADLSGHILVTSADPVTQALIARAKRAGVPHVVIVDEPVTAGALHDDGYNVVVGPLDSPRTYVNAGVKRAAMVVSTHSDTTNTNVAFTVREIDKAVKIAVTANKEASVDVLELAGADQVIQLASTLGNAMARRVLSTSGLTREVGHLGPTRIAEAAARGTDLVGLRIRSVRADIETGPILLAVSERGRMQAPTAGSAITDSSVLLLAGSDEDLTAYDQSFGALPRAEEGTVLILGGGRVGRAAAKVLAASDLRCVTVESDSKVASASKDVVVGDAADLDVLRNAGLDIASDVLVTTHDDDVNVYLTLYCRRLRPDLQIIARATHERNVSTLYRAGADGVLSYASIGATAIWNILGNGQRVVVTEGMEVFLAPIPSALVGHTLPDINDAIAHTGTRVVTLTDEDGMPIRDLEQVPPGGLTKFMMMGDRHAERRFRELFNRRRFRRKRATPI